MDPRAKKTPPRPAIPKDGPIPLAKEEFCELEHQVMEPSAQEAWVAPPSGASAGEAGASGAEAEIPSVGALSLTDLSRLDDPEHWPGDAAIPTSNQDEIEPSPPSAERNGAQAAPQPRTPTRAAGATPATCPPLPVPEELAKLSGASLGRYEAGPVLGAGHCGVVFRARDGKDGRPVALKVLRTEFPKSNDELLHFIQVVKAAMPLRHPHLVTVLNLGRTGPYTWLALDLVEGESLAQILQRPASPEAPPPWHLAFRVAVHAGRALHYAGLQKFVHRGITPRNLVVRSTDQLVKLTDLPLGRALTGSGLRQVTMQAALGTDLPYMAPEQTQPGGKLDCRTDLYSLGAVTYALLTGRLPFAGRTSAETVRMIREVEPVIPGRLDASTPEKFLDILLKLLAKKSEDRYQTPADLLKDLAQIGADPVW